MANRGWSIKSLGVVLGVHPNKVPQAWRPAIRKYALALLANPHLTLIDLTEELDEIRRERESVAAGTLDRSVVHPRR